jgi:hypothetical protein
LKKITFFIEAKKVSGKANVAAREMDWHREVLEERKRRLEEGKATISSWADAKARLLEVGQ